jgi:hypothetical protein
MIDLSVLFSVVLVLILAMATFSGQRTHFDNPSLILWIWLYVIVLVASGFNYILRRKKMSGAIHGLLMLGIGGLGFYGADISQKLIGPDNPAGGVYANLALVSFAVGALAATCGIGVIWRVFGSKKEPRA